MSIFITALVASMAAYAIIEYLYKRLSPLDKIENWERTGYGIGDRNIKKN